MAPGTERVRGAYRVVKTLYSVLTETIRLTCPWIVHAAARENLIASHSLWLQRIKKKAIKQLDI